jgi:TonB-linked SusC/RagA family outer membrane protein
MFMKRIAGCMKSVFILPLLLLFASQSTMAQSTLSVKGRVNAESDQLPLVGATILLTPKNQILQTDENGVFSFTTTDSVIKLTVSYAGYQTKEFSYTLKQANTELNLSLASTSNLEQAVVIGYGTQKRSNVTGAVSRVDSKEFENAPSQNPLVQLQGKVAGLSLQISDGQPGANPQIFLRGGSSTSPESDAPLFVVDGIVGAMRNISDLNPDDIETMQVLKDASTAAIYGARAANGVIIITTKSGKAGRPRISFKYTHGIDRQGKKYDFTSAKDYLYVTRRNIAQFNTTNPDFFLSGGAYGMSTGNGRNAYNTTAFLDKYIQDYGADYVAGLIENEGWETMVDPVTGKKLIFKETNYQDVTFTEASRKELDVSISGGNEKATYYIGLGTLDQDGIVLGSFYKNYNALFNASYKISNSWTLNAGMTYQIRNSNGISNYQNVLSRSVTMPFTYRLNFENGLPAPGEGVNNFRNRNHEVYYRDQYSDNKVLRATYKLGATWDILPGLTFNPTYYYFTTEGLESRFEAFNEVMKDRSASEAHNFDRVSQLDATFNYTKTFKDVHNLNVLLGTSYIDEFMYRMSGTGRGAPTDYIKTLRATAQETQRVTTNHNEYTTLSYFTRLNYDYDGKYLFSAVLRRDGSSRFAKNRKWGYFPGFSVGWNVHKESFFDAVDAVSSLKLRASWGQLGNDGIDPGHSQGVYSTGYTYLGEAGILNTTLANDNLRWETTTSFDVGVDIGLFNNRVNILLDYYSKLTTHRIFDKPLDLSTGFSSIKSNYGSVLNRGFEVEVQASPIRTKDWSWDMAMSFSFIRSTVHKLPENGELKNRTGGNTIYDPATNSYVRVGGTAEGERFGQRYAYHLIGVYATDADAANAPRDMDAAERTKVAGDAIWHDVDGNGRIDYRDMVFMGYIRPDKTGGMQNTVRYKNLSMRFVIDFAMGHVIDNSFRGRLMASARNNNMALSDVLTDKVWQNPGDIASIPRYTVQSDADYNFRNHLRNSNGLGSSSGYTTNNSLYYSKGDYLAFREVSFTYSLKGKFLEKLYMKNLDLFFGVFNIGYLTEYTGLMPEIYTGNDQGSYPRPRQYNFGIKAGL